MVWGAGGGASGVRGDESFGASFGPWFEVVSRSRATAAGITATARSTSPTVVDQPSESRNDPRAASGRIA